MSCTTSHLLNGITTYRNPEPNAKRADLGKVVLAQVAYVLIIPYALVECAIAQTAKAIVHATRDKKKIQRIEEWAQGSSLCLAWTVHCAFGNLMKPQLSATERAFKDYRNHNPKPNRPFHKPTEMSTEEIYGLPNWFGRQIAPIKNSTYKILKNYEIGPNAMQYSKKLDQIYEKLPNVTIANCELLQAELGDLLFEYYQKNPNLRNEIMRDVQDIGYADNARTKEQDRFVKMLRYTITHIVDNNDPIALADMKESLIEANQACSTRRFDEVQRLFTLYVAHSLQLDDLTPDDRLKMDFTRFRTKIRDMVLSHLKLDDTHPRTRISRALNEKLFFLPFPALSEDEGTPSEEQIHRVTQEFRNSYHSPVTIYSTFLSLYPELIGGQNDPTKKNPNFYNLKLFGDWLLEKNIPNEVAYDPNTGNCKTKVLVDFLEDKGYLVKKKDVVA
jgi:hypothetical protein